MHTTAQAFTVLECAHHGTDSKVQRPACPAQFFGALQEGASPPKTIQDMGSPLLASSIMADISFRRGNERLS